MFNRENFRNQIALGWVSLLLIMVTMLDFMIVYSSFDHNGLVALERDPGRGGLRMMTYVIGVYAVVPLITFLVDGLKARAVRWLLVVVAALNLLFMLMHHLAHWSIGQRPDLNSNFLDIVYHLTALWVLYCSIQWARPEKVPQPVLA